MEVLDSRRRGGGAIRVAPYRQARRVADKRTMAFAGVLAVMVEGSVQVLVHISVGAAGNVAVDELSDRVGVALQIVFERGGRLIDAGEGFRDVLHSAFLPVVGRLASHHHTTDAAKSSL